MQLNYKKFGEGFPVVILHGLLGSSNNWQSIAKMIATPMGTAPRNFCVYIIDQRNHGRSPHSDEFSYSLLSHDLFDFFEQHQIAKAHLIGHSMGGKAAMAFALEHADKVEKLVVVDVAPVGYEDHHSDVFSALFAADVRNKSSREDVEKVLQGKLAGDEATVQFLMQNLQRADAGQTGFRWRFNLESLHKNYSRIAEGISSPHPFKGETLFIKGEKSAYINAQNYASMESLFPNHQLTEIKGAGHWVHADKPLGFFDAVRKFLT